jgi:nucleotide-binding universal stress UspA family protein
MKTIAALVDFSDATFKVLKQAHTLASAFGSQVVILHVIPPEPVVVDFGIAPTVMHEPSPEAVKEDADRLRELEESLMKHGVKATSRQIHGSSLESLLDECEQSQADIIIVGSHRHGAIYELLVGSITAGVLKRAKCPVLVVPAGD